MPWILRNVLVLVTSFKSKGPRAHAVKVILTCRENIREYVERFFTVTSYRSTCQKGIYPTSPAEDLDIIPTFEESALSGLFPEGESNSDDEEASDDLDDELLPPSTRRHPGRPRERRIRNTALDITAKKRVYKYRGCKDSGYSKRICVGSIVGN